MKSLAQGQLGSVNVSIYIINHEGKKFDFSQHFLSIDIYEDIVSYGITGSLTFADLLGIKENMPIIGGETIKILFTTDEGFEDWKGEFIITKLAGESQLNSARTNKEIKLYFVSKPIYQNWKRRYAKSYNHKQVSDIVFDIYQYQLQGEKELEIEQTINSINFVIPNWNPFESIQRLMGWATSDLDSGYLFYEDKNKYNFVSISKLFQQQAKRKLLLHRNTEDNKRLSGYIGLVDYFEQVKTIDLIEDYKKGVTGSTLYSFDMALKSFMRHQINAEKTGLSSRLGKYAMHTEMNDFAVISEFKGYPNDRIVNDVDFQNGIDLYAKINARNSTIYNSLNNNSVVISKVGDSDLTAGALVECEVKSYAKEESVNDRVSGLYLIKSIRHQISMEEGYKQVMLVTKPYYVNSKFTNKIGV